MLLELCDDFIVFGMMWYLCGIFEFLYLLVVVEFMSFVLILCVLYFFYVFVLLDGVFCVGVGYVGLCELVLSMEDWIVVFECWYMGEIDFNDFLLLLY